MKRHDFEALLGPVACTPFELAERWSRFALDVHHGSLSQWYARVELVSATNAFEWTDETLDLRDRADLQERLSRDRGGAFTVRLPFGFANGDVTFLSVAEHTPSTAVLVVDPSITRFVYDEPTTRNPFIARLLEAMVALDAPAMLVGAHLHWRPFDSALLLAADTEQSYRCAAAWRIDSLDEGALTSAWGSDPSDVRSSVHGYRVLTRWPQGR